MPLLWSENDNVGGDCPLSSGQALAVTPSHGPHHSVDAARVAEKRDREPVQPQERAVAEAVTAAVPADELQHPAFDQDKGVLPTGGTKAQRVPRWQPQRAHREATAS